MTYKTLSHIVFLSILMALLAGPAAAHDSESPHFHDPASGSFGAFRDAGISTAAGVHSYPGESAPIAFLIIPIAGESFPYHWLWHTMIGEVLDERLHLAHEIMGWYDMPNPHDSGSLEEGGDPTTALSPDD